jgi:hypothetical protein
MLRPILILSLLISSTSFAAPPDAPTTPPQDAATAAEYWARGNNAARLRAQFGTLEEDIIQAQTQTGQFVRARTDESQAKMNQANLFFELLEQRVQSNPTKIYDIVQPISDLFRVNFRKFREAYFTYLMIPKWSEELARQLRDGLITPQFARTKEAELLQKRAQAITDIGTYYGEYIDVLDFLTSIKNQNLLSRPEAGAGALESVSRARAMPQPSPLSEMATAVLYILQGESSFQGFEELGSIRGLPTVADAREVFKQEPEAQLTSLRVTKRIEQSKRNGIFTRSVISALKGFVDAKWIPAAVKPFFVALFKQDYDQQVRSTLNPWIRMLLESPLRGRELVALVFDANSVSRDDDLITTLYRTPKSPVGSVDIVTFRDSLRATAQAESEKECAAGNPNGTFSSYLRRLDAAQAKATTYRDLSLYLNETSPMARKLTCALALGGGAVTAGTLAYQNMPMIQQGMAAFFQFAGLH